MDDPVRLGRFLNIRMIVNIECKLIHPRFYERQYIIKHKNILSQIKNNPCDLIYVYNWYQMQALLEPIKWRNILYQNSKFLILFYFCVNASINLS